MCQYKPLHEYNEYIFNLSCQLLDENLKLKALLENALNELRQAKEHIERLEGSLPPLIPEHTDIPEQCPKCLRVFQNNRGLKVHRSLVEECKR